MQLMSKIVAAAAAAVVSFAGVAVPQASAAPSDAVCNTGEVCFYYNSAAHGYGSLADFACNIPTFNGTGYNRFLRKSWTRPAYAA